MLRVSIFLGNDYGNTIHLIQRALARVFRNLIPVLPPAFNRLPDRRVAQPHVHRHL